MAKSHQGLIITVLLLILSNLDKTLGSCKQTVQQKEEYYEDCEQSYYCEMRTRYIVIPPAICNCANSSDLTEVNSCITTSSIQTHLFIKDSNLAIGPTDMYDWAVVNEVKISENNVTKLVPGCFAALSNLEKLIFSDNNLENFPSGVLVSLKKLESIDFSKNKLSFLDENCFSAVSKLKRVYFSKNNLTFLPEKLFEYQTLLEHIDFSENKLENFTLTNFLNVKFIKLDNNNINKFDSLINLTAETISISFNKIKNFKFFGNIKNLNLSHNLLTIIPENFSSSEVLDLDLSFNNISNISIKAFFKSASLETLDLSHNVLKSIPIGIFQNQQTLQTLNLSHNKLNFLQFGIFNKNKYLKKLDLTNNQISINIGILLPLVSLEVLDLSGNLNTKIDVDLITSQFKNLKHISIDNTSWNCSSLFKAVHRLQHKNISVAEGSEETASNILGIKCSEDNLSHMENVDFEKNMSLSSDDNKYLAEYNISNNKGSEDILLKMFSKHLIDNNDILKNISKMFFKNEKMVSNYLEDNNNILKNIFKGISKNFANKIDQQNNITPTISKVENGNDSQIIVTKLVKEELSRPDTSEYKKLELLINNNNKLMENNVSILKIISILCLVTTFSLLSVFVYKIFCNSQNFNSDKNKLVQEQINPTGSQLYNLATQDDILLT